MKFVPSILKRVALLAPLFGLMEAAAIDAFASTASPEVPRLKLPFVAPSGSTREAADQYLSQFDKVPLSVCLDRAEHGDRDAQYCAARALMKSGAPRDKQLAITYLRASAEAGHFFAQNDLGHYLLKGLGAPKDLKAALHWFMKAAEAGVANAMVSVGWHYMCGLGVETDYERAREWNLRGAREGIAEGANNLGWLYEYGLGGPRDLDAARRWYREGASGGSDEAAERLENLELAPEKRRVLKNECNPLPESSTSSLKEALDQAIKLGQRSDYSGAERGLKTLLPRVARRYGSASQEYSVVIAHLADSLYRQSRYAEAEPLYQLVLAIDEKVHGAEHPDVATGLNNLAALYQAQGRHAEAEALHRRALAVRERVLGGEHPDVGQSLNNLAVLYKEAGRYSEAELLYRRALAIGERTLGAEHSNVMTTLSGLAELYGKQGRYSEAEPIHRRVLTIGEKIFGLEHPSVATGLDNFAGTYQRQGRHPEAELLYKRALTIRTDILGVEHPDVGRSLNNLAVLYETQGRYGEAEPLFRQALTIWEKTLGPEHPSVTTGLNNLALVYGAQRRYTEAESLLRWALAIEEKTLGPEHPGVATGLNNLALVREAQGHYTEAERLLRQALAIWEKALGPEHPSAVSGLTNLARIHLAQERIEEALVGARRASVILANRLGAKDGGQRQGLLAEQRTRSEAFEQHLAILAARANRVPNLRGEATSEGFEVAQFARAGDTAEQVAKMAARYAAGSDALARLARRQQDALARQEAIEASILRVVSSPTAGRNRAAESNLREEADAASKAIVDLAARIEREYPQYRELIDPKPLALKAAQTLLAPDEGLVVVLVSHEESFVWAVRREQAGFHRLALTRSELADAVRKLRAQLDLGVDDPAVLISRPFDVAAAHALYKVIFDPIEPLLVGVRNLIFVPDGALQSLPLGVLVTDPPAKPTAGLADHGDVLWLAKKYAVTVLPAASSLRALRQFAKESIATEPFGGFGDPVLAGGGDARRAYVPGLYSRGTVADVDEVRKLARLPESADELRTIGAALKASPGAIRLGAAATERAVKEANLTRYRNLAFATHGLMAGEFRGLAEPALVLTPPAEGSELDDGLLTASEISQLRLDADWVVLSACNTAAPDGTPGAEGLSGLARAFFYAGARALLVSHWAVSSDATVALTTRMFDEWANGADKAEALRRSMLALMARTDRPHYAHPAFWAPFVVVGDRGSARQQIRRQTNPG